MHVRQKFSCRKDGCSQKHHTLLRESKTHDYNDYTIIYLCIDNASRTGALASMTCRKLARSRQENGSGEVAIFNRKPIAAPGRTSIVSFSTLYEEANIYYPKFHSNLGGIDLTDKNFPFLLLRVGTKWPPIW